MVASEKSYTFVYLSELDVVGHAQTWCNEEYMDYVETSDRQVGQLLDVVDDLDAWDETLVIVSTDHGGYLYL